MRVSKKILAMFVYVLSVAIVITGVPAKGVFAEPCPGANDAYGPCSDSGGTTTTGGDGWCGACSNETVVYIGGNCSGGGGSGAFNCNDCVTTWKTRLTTYTSIPVGSVAQAACYAAWAACVAAGGPLAIPGCDCLYDECVTVCIVTGGPIYTGSESACS